MQEAVQICDLTFSYGNIQVLRKLNFSLQEGEWIGIQGANGAGKSTFLHLLLGLKRADSGEILLFGQDVEKFTDWEWVSFVSQSSFSRRTQFPASVEEIVSMPLQWRRKKRLLSKENMKREMKRALRLVQMEDFIHRQLNQLSGGQVQRVQLAQALAGHPKLILLDEPTTGLDKETTAELDHLFEGLRRRREESGLVISHDLHWLKSSVDSVYTLDKGVLERL